MQQVANEVTASFSRGQGVERERNCLDQVSDVTLSKEPIPLRCLAGLSNLLASVGHTGRRRVVLGHTLNSQTLTKTDEQKKKVLSIFIILC